MKALCLMLFAMTYCMLSCNSHSGKLQLKESVDSIMHPVPDRSKANNYDTTVADTIHGVNIEQTICNIIVLQDRYDIDHEPSSEEELATDTLRIIIVNAASGRVLFSRRFEQNEYKFFKNGNVPVTKDGKLFLSLTTNSGGSGLAIVLYQVAINRDGTGGLVHVMDYGELTSFAFNKTETEMLRFVGDWNFDEHETHFEEHRQKIVKYILEDGQYKEVNLGETKFKYSSESDFKETLQQINTREPVTLKNININDYSFWEQLK